MRSDGALDGKIAASKGEAFYRGELAEKMVAHAQSLGGAHTLADFAAHTCDWVDPIGIDYRGSTVHEIPPNGQGIAALMALGIVENFDMASLANDSARSLHVQIEAMKLAFADAYRYVSDPRTMEVTPAQTARQGVFEGAREADRPEPRQPFCPWHARARRHRVSDCRR